MFFSHSYLTKCCFIKVFKSFVEAGRVCWVSYGEDYGKICVIVDIRDQNCVLVDGDKFPRVLYPLKRLTLTNIHVPLLRGARTKTVLKAFKDHNIGTKWESNNVCKKMQRKATRDNLNDFERFQVMLARKGRSNAIRKCMKKVK